MNNEKDWKEKLEKLGEHQLSLLIEKVQEKIIAEKKKEIVQKVADFLTEKRKKKDSEKRQLLEIIEGLIRENRELKRAVNDIFESSNSEGSHACEQWQESNQGTDGLASASDSMVSTEIDEWSHNAPAGTNLRSGTFFNHG